MRKTIISRDPRPDNPSDEHWLDLEQVSQVEISSEAPANPIEAALLPGGTPGGWRAAVGGEQTIRLIFDRPQPICRVWLRFDEPSHERTQEFVLRCRKDGETDFQDLVRQQWNFSPTGATIETEDYRFDLADVAALELCIIPDISNGRATASLSELRVA